MRTQRGYAAARKGAADWVIATARAGRARRFYLGEAMDFIERWFGVAPDGGSGVFEAGVILSLAAIGCVVVFRGRLRRIFMRQG
jgi:hypothetical protein